MLRYKYRVVVVTVIQTLLRKFKKSVFAIKTEWLNVFVILNAERFNTMHQELLIKVLFLYFFLIQPSSVYSTVLHRLYITSDGQDGQRVFSDAFELIPEKNSEITDMTEVVAEVRDSERIPILFRQSEEEQVLHRMQKRTVFMHPMTKHSSILSNSLDEEGLIATKFEIRILVQHIPDLRSFPSLKLEPKIRYGKSYKKMKKITKYCHYFPDEGLILEELEMTQGVNAHLLIPLRGLKKSSNLLQESINSKIGFYWILYNDGSGVESVTPWFIKNDNAISLASIELDSSFPSLENEEEEDNKENGTSWLLVISKQQGAERKYFGNNVQGVANNSRFDIKKYKPVIESIAARSHGLRLPTVKLSVFATVPLDTRERYWQFLLEFDDKQLLKHSLDVTKDSKCGVIEWDIPDCSVSRKSIIHISKDTSLCPRLTYCFTYLTQSLYQCMIGRRKDQRLVDSAENQAGISNLNIRLFKKGFFQGSESDSDSESEESRELGKSGGQYFIENDDISSRIYNPSPQEEGATLACHRGIDDSQQGGKTVRLFTKTLANLIISEKKKISKKNKKLK